MCLAIPNLFVGGKLISYLCRASRLCCHKDRDGSNNQLFQILGCVPVRECVPTVQESKLCNDVWLLSQQ